MLLLLPVIFSAVAFMHVCFTVGPVAAGIGEGRGWAGRGSTGTQSSCCCCCCCCCLAYLKAFIIEKVLRLCVAIAGAFHLTCRSHLIFHLEWPLATAPPPSPVPCTFSYLVLSLPASLGQPLQCVKSTVSVDLSWLRLCL